MSVEGNDHFFDRDSNLLRRPLQDSFIRLVGNEPVDVTGGQIMSLQRFLHASSDRIQGKAEDFLALHPQMADRLGRGRSAVDIELIPMAPVREKH